MVQCTRIGVQAYLGVPQVPCLHVGAPVRTFVRVVSNVSPVVPEGEVSALVFLSFFWWRLLQEP